MSLEEHLNRFTGGGTYYSAGIFTLDRDKALEKLAGFSLETWLDVLFLLGAWLDSDGNEPTDFELSRRKLTVRRPSTRLTREQVEHLEDFVLVGTAAHGVSHLALVQHVWFSDGAFSVSVEGSKRCWEKGASRVEDCPEQMGVTVEFSHKSISGKLDQVAEFLARHFAWTSYPWSINGLPMATKAPPTRLLMTLNSPDLVVQPMPGVALEKPEYEFQMYCLWRSDGQTAVVVEGVAYSLKVPLVEGLTIAVFSDKVQRNLTRTEAIVSKAQRERWLKALDELVRAFAQKDHFWSNKEFFGQFGSVFCRTLWNNFDHPACLAAAQRLASLRMKERFSPLILARIAIAQGDFPAALFHLKPVPRWSLSSEEKAYVRTVDSEFAERLPEFSLTEEQFHELRGELELYMDLGPCFPNAIHRFCFSLARAGEELGLISLAERLYFASYFLPRGVKSDWSTFLHVHSYMDTARNRLPEWLADMDKREEQSDGIWAVVDMAHRCQSTQAATLVELRELFRFSKEQPLHHKLNLRRMESWRLERKAALAEWFKWHLVAGLEGLPPRYPPLSFDQSFQMPSVFLAESVRSRLLRLRCETAYLEYAARSVRCAEKSGQQEQSQRFRAIVRKMGEVFDRYEDSDAAEELAELGRIAIELGRYEDAAEMLRRAVCKYPVGDFKRLPLLVDMAILEPHRSDSVLDGLTRVLGVELSRGGAFDRIVQDCAWPFPFELPSRLRRLAWELEPSKALKVYGLARVLFRKAYGSSWMEPTEQDWVIDAINLLKR